MRVEYILGRAFIVLFLIGKKLINRIIKLIFLESKELNPLNSFQNNNPFTALKNNSESVNFYVNVYMIKRVVDQFRLIIINNALKIITNFILLYLVFL